MGESDHVASNRRPWLAALTNFLVPGLGPLYAGDIRATVLWAATPPIVALVLAVSGLHLSVQPLNVVLFWVSILAFLVGSAVVGWRAATRAPRPFVPTTLNRWWVYALYGLVVVLAGNWFLDGWYRPHVMEAFRNPAASMEPTLQIGDYFLVAKTPGRRPSRGSLVVFASVEEPGLKVLKRAVGLEGDTLAMADKRLLLNGHPVSEPYAIYTGSKPGADTITAKRLSELQMRFQPADTSTWSLRRWGPLVLPPGTMFVLGDNRDQSYDSRYYGPVPFTSVLGHPRMIYLSIGQRGIRWARLGRFAGP